MVPVCFAGTGAPVSPAHRTGWLWRPAWLWAFLLNEVVGHDLPAVGSIQAAGSMIMVGNRIGSMEKILRRLTRSSLAAILAMGAVTLDGQPYRAPRGPGGKPDLNGIWQALNEANYDIEAHVARPAMALRPGPFGPVPAAQVLALGAVGAAPPGLGVVEGGEIPYKPEALAQKKQNQQDWLNRDPEIKCYLPGVPRATYMPYPFQILQSASALTFVYEYAGAVRNI